MRNVWEKYISYYGMVTHAITYVPHNAINAHILFADFLANIQ